ncbi:MAG: phosphoenolpyruvate--protein phosphotransferase, partial [Kiloniellales bacterium]|nr:phosphoenolpyruvate--protein phosphotransferase [Kiloniellales bacterium]
LEPAPPEADLSPGPTDTDPSRERVRLDAAIAEASLALTDLLDGLGNDEEAAGMVEFQLAMLEDDALVDPAYRAIETGSDAVSAWRQAMDQALADYETADDSYFRARASDLADMRDRVGRGLEGLDPGKIPEGVVFVGRDLPPSRFLETDWQGGGIALFAGSANSHVAMLARARGIPMVIDMEPEASADLSGTAILDGAAGTLILNPTPEEIALFEARRRDETAAARRALRFLDKPAVTKSGEAVTVMVNVAGPEDIEALDPGHCDGVGLVRTEFLFHASDGQPDEETQFAFYRDIVRWAGGKPVTLRTLDAGGDKPIPGLTVDGETNPFLGIRGLRLSLRHPDVFRVQLRAMLRAAAFGPVKIMLPMVTAPEELAAARSHFEEARRELAAQGIEAGAPSFGMMVEVPSAAIAIDEFDADFYSIGSNDLVQYVTACGRDVGGLGDLARPDCTAVLRLMERVARHGRKTGREVSLCGDAGGDPAVLPRLLEAGLRAFSVAPSALARTKAAIAAYEGAGHD